MTHSGWDTDERIALAELAADFARKEILPNQGDWERDGLVPRELHRKAADLGLLGIGIADDLGGSGGDFIDVLVFHDAMLRAGVAAGTLVALTPHIIALPSVIACGAADHVDRFVRPVLSGEMVCALAVTEPDGGSDVGGIRTRAVHRDGEWIINGGKTFISSGVRADVLTVAARTTVDGIEGITLFLVETDRPGFVVTRTLDKMGWLSSDTGELSFDDVTVPASNVVGTVNRGFVQLMGQFQTERLILAQHCCALGRRALDLTVEWTKQRHTFSAALASRQAVRHRIADMWTRLAAAEALVGVTAAKVVAGEDVSVEAAAAKNTAVAAGEWVASQAVQLFGGAGYMRDTEVERIYRDMRLYGIGGGTTEIMRDLISKKVI